MAKLSEKARALMEKSISLFARGQWNECIRACTELLNLAEKDASIPDKFKVDVYNNRAIAYREEGKYDLALDDLNQALVIDPNSVMAYNNRGTVYFDKKDYDRAISSHSKALEIAPNDPHSFYNRGNAHLSKNDLDRAIDDYTQCLNIDPSYSSAYRNRGSAYFRKDNYESAIADYDAALKFSKLPADSPVNAELIRDRAMAILLNNAREEIRQQYQEQIEKHSANLLRIEEYEKRRIEYQNKADKTEKRIKWGFACLHVGVLTALAITVGVAYVLLVQQENEIWPGILPIFPLITVLGLSISPLIWRIRTLNQEKSRLMALSQDAYTKGILANLINVNIGAENRKELLHKFFDHHTERGTAQLIVDLENNGKSESGAVNVLIKYLKDNMSGKN